MGKKILFFDYWLKGLHNIIPLYESISSTCDCCLLHVSSLQEIEEPSFQVIEGLDCYDISYFKDSSLLNALKSINPDVIVTFNTTYILDRAVCLEAKKLKITTIFFQHGSRLNITEKNFKAYQARKISGFLKTQKIMKSVRYISRYLKAKPISPSDLVVSVKVVFEFLFKPKKAKLFPFNVSECLADFCCVYSDAEKPYYQALGYLDQQIKVVGNPKLKRSRPFIHKKPYVLFIDEGLPEAGNCYGVTNSMRSLILNRLVASLKRIDYELIVKPHPLAEKNNFDQKSYMVLDNEIGSLIAGAEACICNVSTAGDNVVLEKKPFFSLSDAEFSKVPKPYLESGMSADLHSSEAHSLKQNSRNLVCGVSVKEFCINDLIDIINSSVGRQGASPSKENK